MQNLMDSKFGPVLDSIGVLTEVESEVIDVDDLEEGEEEACLVGRLVTGGRYNRSYLIKAIEEAWNPKHGMSSSLRKRELILFHFNNVMDREWVLNHQPWHFMGSLFAIEKFTGGNEQQPPSLDNVTVEHASFWVRLYDVPVSCMNERSLRLFAKQIGVLESVDKSDEDSIGEFVRFKISLNITKPLLRGISIRVKGKQLWLPLKYESLPSYCFSCGIIGHERKYCPSDNRNLRYSKLGAPSWTERKKIEQETPTILPRDIIENILSRVSVKYLIRFKVVCKQWEAIISDPGFAEVQLQHHKRSSSRNLLAWEERFGDTEGILVSRLQDDQLQFVLQFVSAIEVVGEDDISNYPILCNCDGLYLKHYEYGDDEYVLWNPSCRAYRAFTFPEHDGFSYRRRHLGIYYYPLMKDYRVVIADMNNYAVFSCRYNKWSEVKEIRGSFFSDKAYIYSEVSCNGSVYWLLTHSNKFEIICFDGKDEMFRKVAMPEFDGNAERVTLTSCGSYLWLFNNSRYGEMRIMKKVEKDSWTEFKVQLSQPNLRPPNLRPLPLCWVSEHEILLGDYGCNFYLLYNLKFKTFDFIEKSRLGGKYGPLPYVENLFVQ